MGDFKAPTAKPVTLVGCCHCKANKYTIRLQEMKTVHYCTCSVCTAHSFLWLFPDPSAVTIESSGPLSSYEWNTKKFRFEFCSSCGCHIRSIIKESGAAGLNARLLQDVNLWDLDLQKADGAAIEPSYKQPAYQGPPFAQNVAKEDKQQTYYGSCHCGAVTLAMQGKPLSQQMINECNCSFCWRAARVHCYPEDPSDVHLSGASSLSRYKVSPEASAYFCRDCGTQLVMALDESGAGAMPQTASEALGHSLHIVAVNIRELHGVDMDMLRINKHDARGQPPIFQV